MTVLKKQAQKKNFNKRLDLFTKNLKCLKIIKMF